MSPASYLAAPPRVARRDCSTVAATIVAVWSWWILWIALAVAVVAPIAATVRTTRLGLGLWRDLRAARRRVFGELDRLADAADAAATQAEQIAGGSDKLSAGLDRLARSRRRLAVLQEAWAEVTDSAGAITAVYPRKPQA